MKQRPILFILGAGASVDSGMKVYRSVTDESAYYEFDENDIAKNHLHVSALHDNERMEKMWQHLKQLYQDCDKAVAGPTYQTIQEMVRDSPCLLLTQNVDGLVHSVTGDNVSIIELHGTHSSVSCINCGMQFKRESNVYHCSACNGWLRPNIVLFGEPLADNIGTDIFMWIAEHHPTTCYVVGTSMRFSYLRSIIDKAKSKGAHVIHVNPDPDYYWHRKKEKWTLCAGEPHCRLVDRKKPEELKTKF